MNEIQQHAFRMRKLLMFTMFFLLFLTVETGRNVSIYYHYLFHTETPYETSDPDHDYDYYDNNNNVDKNHDVHKNHRIKNNHTHSQSNYSYNEQHEDESYHLLPYYILLLLIITSVILMFLYQTYYHVYIRRHLLPLYSFEDGKTL